MLSQDNGKTCDIIKTGSVAYEEKEYKMCIKQKLLLKWGIVKSMLLCVCELFDPRYKIVLNPFYIV